MYMDLIEQTPQALPLHKENPSWLSVQDEDGSLSSLNAEEQNYVPEKKGRNLFFTNPSHYLFGQVSQHKVLSCVITLDAESRACSQNNPNL